MKRRVMITLLALTVTATMITGCGNKPDGNQIMESTVETTEETQEESAESEPETESGSQPETQEENFVEATPEEPSEESTPETDTDMDASQTTPKPEEKPAAGSEPVIEPVTPETTPVADVISPEGQNAAEQPQARAYNVTEMAATMYVKNSVNLRQGPGTEYTRVGSLNKGDQVTVTGQADNGWYQLETGAFVSNKYLSSDAPAATIPAAAPGAAVVPADTAMFPTVDENGVITLPNLLGIDPYVANATEFFDYLNQQRSAAGLCTLTWDSDMAAVAQRRAKELASDFSHNGNTERYNENIHTTNDLNSTYKDWYNSFYNSQAHRETMMNPNIGRGAAALYFDGRNYYVICNFRGNPLTTEELLEQFNPDNMVQISENAYIDKRSYDALINAGIDPGAQPDEETIKRMDELTKLAEEGLIEVPSLN